MRFSPYYSKGNDEWTYYDGVFLKLNVTLFFFFFLLQSTLCSKISDYDLTITLFSLGDTNRNHKLDESEITEFYKNEIQFPVELAEFVGKSMIERGDLNGDSALSPEGMLIFMLLGKFGNQHFNVNLNTWLPVYFIQ